MKTHNQEMLTGNLDLLQTMAVNEHLGQRHLQSCIESLEEHQQEDNKLAADYVELVKDARKSCESTSQQIARIKAEIMRLCHD